MLVHGVEGKIMFVKNNTDAARSLARSILAESAFSKINTPWSTSTKLNFSPARVQKQIVLEPSKKRHEVFINFENSK